VRVADLSAHHQVVALDSNVLIYLLEQDQRRSEAVSTVIDAIGAGEVEGVLATVGVSEVLVGFARRDDPARFEMLATGMRDLGLRFPVLDAAAAEDAAWIYGATGLGLPDAIHLACARSAGATAFLTNDRRIHSRPGLEVVYLDDLLGAEASVAPG
jgi:predicted nucleic acid-binding protein